MTEIVPRWEWRWFGPPSRACRISPGGNDPGRRAGERRDLPALRGRRQRQGARRAHGHQGPARGGSRRPGAVDARHEGGIPLAGDRGDQGIRGAAASIRHRCGVRATAWRSSSTNSRCRAAAFARSACTSDEPATPWADAWPSLSEVVADGKPTRTIAVESEDAAAVIAAVRSLGLGGYVNTSYPRGLAALIDGKPSRYAVIDVGTNSVKFHLGERDRDGKWRAVVDRAEMTRLGEGLEQHQRHRRRRARADGSSDRGHGR